MDAYGGVSTGRLRRQRLGHSAGTTGRMTRFQRGRSGAGACPGTDSKTKRTDHELHKPERWARREDQKQSVRAIDGDIACHSYRRALD
jgi:hypothetical protein